MSRDAGGAAGPPVTREDLIEAFHAAALPAEQPALVGLEVEWLALDPATGRAVPYAGERGIEALLHALLEAGFEDPYHAARPTHLERGRQTVDLEPGAQLEFGTSPLPRLDELAHELRTFAETARAAAARLGFRLVGLAVQPASVSDEIVCVPKRRYAIMERYFASHGDPRWRDMMRLTASIQVNLDYRSERDAGRKLRAATLLAPVLAALFANAPLSAGRPSRYRSERLAIWRQTEARRAGALGCALAGPWSFERLVDELLAIPALLVRAEDGGVADAHARPFGALLREGIGTRRAELADWDLHLSGIFTDARLKRRVVECRAPDAVPLEAAIGVAALYTGLLYDEAALDETLAELAPLAPQYDRAMAAAAQAGLDAEVAGHSLRALATRALERAAHALRRRGHGEQALCEPLRAALEPGKGFAERSLAAFERGGLPAVIEHNAL